MNFSPSRGFTSVQISSFDSVPLAISQVRHDIIYGRGIPETFRKIICIRKCKFGSHAIVCLPFVLNRIWEQYRSFSSDASLDILAKIFKVELPINNPLKKKKNDRSFSFIKNCQGSVFWLHVKLFRLKLIQDIKVFLLI